MEMSRERKNSVAGVGRKDVTRHAEGCETVGCFMANAPLPDLVASVRRLPLRAASRASGRHVPSRADTLRHLLEPRPQPRGILVLGFHVEARRDPDVASRTSTNSAWYRPDKPSGSDPLSSSVEADIGVDDPSSLAAPLIGGVAHTGLRRSEA